MSSTPLLDIYATEIVPTLQNQSGLYGYKQYNDASRSKMQAAFYGWDVPRFPYQTVVGDMENITELAGLRASKGFEYDQLSERNRMLEQFAKQGDAFNIQMIQQGQAASTFSSRLEGINTRLGAIRQSAMTAASPASSQRQYSQLAQSALEGTSRYFQELERFKAPTAPTVDFSFQDPITGEIRQLGTKFEDVWSGGYDHESAARTAITSKFKTLTEQKKAQLLEESKKKYGTVEDFLKPYGGDEAKLQAAMGNWQMGQWAAGTKAKGEYWNQYQAAKTIEADAQQFAEAAAVAEIGDITTVGGQYSSTGYKQFSGASVFYDKDINQILENFVAPTAERLRISRLGDEKAVREEFKRREQAAQAQYNLYVGQQQRQAEQQQQIEAEKQRVRQLLSEQKREYASTMASFGDTTSSQQGAGIQFTDTRPQ